MFNNLIYFIIVLLIFNINFPDSAPESSLLYTLTMLFLTWLIFAGYCKWEFNGLRRQLGIGEADEGRMTGHYQKLVARLSVMAIFLFALAVYLFNLKYWLQLIPWFKWFSVLQGSLALSLFFIYLGTIWYFGYPVYKALFRPGITRRSFIQSNLRLNFPILFPWIVLSLVYDLIGLSPWSGPDSFLNGVVGQLLFFATFLTLLIIFLPGFIQYWWGCQPLKPSEKGRELEAFMQEKDFKCRHILEWPLFEGKMLTAGIMGIVPRYRYILMTESLLKILSIEELKSVVAHEMGHAKYRHIIFYILFFVGFMVLSLGLFDLFFYLLLAHPFFMGIISGKDSAATNLFYLMLSIPMLITLLVYFRYVMGFFMRNFERQADLYSAVTMGTPQPAISSLEKIAYSSGKSRDLPSWHHFSIRERVEYLLKTLRDPGLVRRHNRFLLVSFLIYLVGIVGLGYFLNFSPMKQHLTYALVGKVLNQQLAKDPDNIALYQNLVTIYHQMGKDQEAIKAYEKIIDLDPNQAASLNNLAWLLVTASNEELRDKTRALELAKRAVALKRSPVFLDTLAEAYYANGFISEAVTIIEEAISLATEGRGYYERQLKKFLGQEKGRAINNRG
ncbi:MAG: M48 family metalloprotease [Desulfobacteraceae bacterium]|nr:M48 family metalloprotease [Desulfobacteraceae bacterium]